LFSNMSLPFVLLVRAFGTSLATEPRRTLAGYKISSAKLKNFSNFDGTAHCLFPFYFC